MKQVFQDLRTGETRLPAAVGDEAAAFTVLGAIALQGMRLAQPTLGEAFVVSGLGLIGLLTVQLLRAQGCRVLGMEFDAQRLALARQLGADTVDLSGGPPRRFAPPRRCAQEGMGEVAEYALGQHFLFSLGNAPVLPLR